MKIVFLILIFIMLICGCNYHLPDKKIKKDQRSYLTWESKGEKPIELLKDIPVMQLPEAGEKPWAGIVSHHLLADNLIDRWFLELSSRRKVKTFYVLSPSHWNLSVNEFSITDGEWICKNGVLESDKKSVQKTASDLDVELEYTVFDYEHGISTLAPYIKKYFPKAKIVAICYKGEPPVSLPMVKKLSNALKNSFDEKGRKNNFLLISSDFAHHDNYAGTMKKDTLTMKYFENPSVQSWIYAGCDNRPGIYSIASLSAGRDTAFIMFHENSFSLSNKGENDITSYFFVFFIRKEDLIDDKRLSMP